jgi:hypothetical protein
MDTPSQLESIILKSFISIFFPEGNRAHALCQTMKEWLSMIEKMPPTNVLFSKTKVPLFTYKWYYIM